MQYAKEYMQLTHKQPPANVNVVELIEKGLPVGAVDELAKLLELNKTEVANLLGVTLRALQQRRTGAERGIRLTGQLTDKAFQLVRLMNEITDYFGSRAAANKWMKTPNMVLGDVAPIDLCNKGVGMDMVRDVVNRMKYGMTA